MNVPKLRFPGFEEKWEKKKFEEIASYTKGFAFKSTEYKKTGYRIIRVSDLLQESINTKNETICICPSTVKKYENYKINNGDILVTTVGSKPELISSAVGRTIYYKDNVDQYLNQNLVKLETHKEHDSYFVYLLTKARKYINHIENIQRGNANQSNITIKELLEFVTYIPALAEQKKIANLFDFINRKIQLQQKKIDLLEEQKKGYMQKIFSQELRFKDEDGNCFPKWETKPLENGISSLKSGLSRKLSHLDIGIPVIRANNIDDGRLDLTDIKYWYLNDPQGAQTHNYFVKQGDILINFINSESKMGTTTIVEENLCRDMIYTTNILKLETNAFLNNYYFYIYSQTERYKNYIKLITKPAVNQASFTTVDFKAHLIPYPCIEEQIKIATFFKSINTRIYSEIKKLQQLNQQKQAFMQQMFI